MQPVIPGSHPIQAIPPAGDRLREESSSEYGFDDDLDPDTLNALDALEQTMTESSSSQIDGM